MQQLLAVLLITLTAGLLCTGVVLGYALRVARSGRLYFPRLGASPGSALLPGWLVEGFYWALHAPARALVRSGIEPDTLTYASLVICVASAPLVASGHFALGAAVIVFGSGLDALDGMVARARGVAGPSGAVLDSFVDRLADAAPFIGLAIFYRNRADTLAIPIVAMLASSLVSYARAKADIYKLRLPNGLMRRHERVVYLVLSLLIAPVAPRLDFMADVPYPLTLAGITIIGGVGLVASFVLVARTRAALSASPKQASPALPERQVRPIAP
jgi:CDP-diacylglycerol--glycerol-3-phosphate 3-phosphatidyltransferase